MSDDIFLNRITLRNEVETFPKPVDEVIRQ
jgi:hypothetical protein